MKSWFKHWTSHDREQQPLRTGEQTRDPYDDPSVLPGESEQTAVQGCETQAEP